MTKKEIREQVFERLEYHEKGITSRIGPVWLALVIEEALDDYRAQVLEEVAEEVEEDEFFQVCTGCSCDALVKIKEILKHPTN